MESLQDAVDEVADRTGFSGVVRVDRDDVTLIDAAYGYADRLREVPNAEDTRFAVASVTKGFTALVVMTLVERGTLGLEMTARSLLGEDLPLIDDDVTVEHLLGHRSGIGDYLDEEALDEKTAYVLPVPAHLLATAEDYRRVLDGFPMVLPAGERFTYNNGGYVVLALLAERAAEVSYHELVRTLVCEPAGMADTAFLRSDELSPRAATCYLEVDGLRTNVLHMPLLGIGDGGLYTTVADLHAFWKSFFGGRIVGPDTAAEMVRPRSTSRGGSARYGLGFWLDATGDEVWLTGSDAGISAGSSHTPSTATTATVISNWTDGAWPLVKLLDERLGS
jgi:CubicO group peptidase (beta-lactamase class C family)